MPTRNQSVINNLRYPSFDTVPIAGVGQIFWISEHLALFGKLFKF